MNTPKRIERMSGYQQSFIDIQSNSPPATSKPDPLVSDETSPLEGETKEIFLSEEISTYDGKIIYSYHPKVCEIIKMNDTNSDKKPTEAMIIADVHGMGSKTVR